MTNTDRYKKGWAQLKKIHGETGEGVIDSLKDISPDLGKFIIEYAFGDIYTREGLDLKSKEIAVVAALTAMATAQPQLKVHMGAALNTGCHVNEIKEVVLQMAVYSGFPNCLNAMSTLQSVLKERQEKGIIDRIGDSATDKKPEQRLKIGEEELSKLDPSQEDKLKKTYGHFSPDLVRLILEYGYGDIFSREGLSKQHRQVATIAALTALGNAQPQLTFHINAGMNIGLTKKNIEEVILLMHLYAGFPATINAMNALKSVISERLE